MAEDQGDAFLAGKQAAQRGEAADGNPHEPGSRAHDLWKDGHASIGPPEDISEELGKFA